MHAESVAAAQWWERPRGEQNQSWIGNYKNSIKSRHRDVIVSAVRSIPGTASILEVGSHCGPNLIRLAHEIPALTSLAGIDVNAEAVTAGNAWAKDVGLSHRINIGRGDLSATGQLPDGSVDVVLSCYALAYVSPKDLDDVLWEMGRVAKRAVILAEPMTIAAVSDQRMTLAGYREWSHNYSERTRWIGSWRGSTTTMHPVTPPVDRLAQVLVAVKPPSP